MEPPDKCNGKAQHAHRTHTHTARPLLLLKTFLSGIFVVAHVSSGIIYITLRHTYQLAFLWTEHHIRTCAHQCSILIFPSILFRIHIIQQYYLNVKLMETKFSSVERQRTRSDSTQLWHVWDKAAKWPAKWPAKVSEQQRQYTINVLKTTIALLNLVDDTFPLVCVCAVRVCVGVCGRPHDTLTFPYIMDYATASHRTKSETCTTCARAFLHLSVSTHMRRRHFHQVQARRHKINDIYLQAFV